MSLTNTTLSSAMGVTDTSIVVASATGFSAGYYVRVDGELSQVAKSYVSGTTIPLTGRGLNGGIASAHPASAKVAVGPATDADWNAVNGPTATTQYPAAAPQLRASYSASGAIALPTPGTDLIVELNGTSALAMTIAAPTTSIEGSKLWVASNGAANHTVQFTGGLSGAGNNYDVITINSTAPALLGPFMAVNQLWQAAVAVPMAGTMSNITGTLA